MFPSSFPMGEGGCSLDIRLRNASWLLWEPELNLMVKAGVALWATSLANFTFFLLSVSFSHLPFSISLSPSLQAFLLQTVDGKHQDLKYISPETVHRDEPFSRHN